MCQKLDSDSASSDVAGPARSAVQASVYEDLAELSIREAVALATPLVTPSEPPEIAEFNQAVRYLLMAMDHVKNMIEYHSSPPAGSGMSPLRRTGSSASLPSLADAFGACADDELADDDVNDSMLADAIERLNRLRAKVLSRTHPP